ncbi:MAG: hypothetical protein HS130_06050 [Deltaproteobacteria bacterium]|nr:hypothetical protein [Deltaproteobacteria bacterium]
MTGTSAPAFPETGHTNPTSLTASAQEGLYGLVTRAATSLGIEFGPYKADTIMTKGPMVIELPARLSGSFHSQYTTPLATALSRRRCHCPRSRLPVRKYSLPPRQDRNLQAVFPSREL